MITFILKEPFLSVIAFLVLSSINGYSEIRTHTCKDFNSFASAVGLYTHTIITYGLFSPIRYKYRQVRSEKNYCKYPMKQ